MLLGSANFAFADGSVRFLKDSIQTSPFNSTIGVTGDIANFTSRSTVVAGTQNGVYQELSTRNGGEVISRDSY